jgi:hypothetical protein
MTLARVGLKELMAAHANALAEVEQDEAEWNEAGDDISWQFGDHYQRRHRSQFG